MQGEGSFDQKGCFQWPCGDTGARCPAHMVVVGDAGWSWCRRAGTRWWQCLLQVTPGTSCWQQELTPLASLTHMMRSTHGRSWRCWLELAWEGRNTLVAVSSR